MAIWESLMIKPVQYAVFGFSGGLIRFFNSSTKNTQEALETISTAVIVAVVFTPLLQEYFGMSEVASRVAAFMLGLHGSEIILLLISIGKEIWQQRVKEWLLNLLRTRNPLDK